MNGDNTLLLFVVGVGISVITKCDKMLVGDYRLINYWCMSR